MKIYLIGILNPNYHEDFSVVRVASTIEKAKIMKKILDDEKLNIDYEIREFEVDVVNPIGDIDKTKLITQYGDEELYYLDQHPYKIIEDNS